MMTPMTSWPPGSGWTGKHWVMAVLAGVVEGSLATAQFIPSPIVVAIAHVVAAVSGAMVVQLGFTTPSVQTVRAAERFGRR